MIILVCAASVSCKKQANSKNIQVSLNGDLIQGISIEKNNDGDAAIHIPDINLLVGILAKDPISGGYSCSVTVGESPLHNYSGINQPNNDKNYMDFYSKKLKGSVRDNDLDGFPDEAIIPDLGRVKLQTWIVDEEGNRIKKIN